MQERQQLLTSDCGQYRHPSSAPQENVWAPPFHGGGHHPHNYEWELPTIQANDGFGSHQRSTVAYFPPTGSKGTDGEDNEPCYHQYHYYTDAAAHYGPGLPTTYHPPLPQYSTVQSDSGRAPFACSGGADFGAISHPARSPLQWDSGPSTSPFPDDLRRRGRAKTFPEKLMHAFMECPNEDSVAWLPDGKSFVIVNQELFVREVLNKFFKATKYASFIRKLHRWGYVRLTSGTGTDCFHHPHFTINDPRRAALITCAAPQHKKSVLLKNSLSKPSLVGVERFIRTKAAVGRANRAEGYTIRALQSPPSSTHLQHGEPSEVTSSSTNNSVSGESMEARSMSQEEGSPPSVKLEEQVDASTVKQETASSRDDGLGSTK